MFDLAPLLEMSSHDLFRLGARASLLDTPNIKRTVLSGERANTTHVVTIVGKLVARETVFTRVGQRAFWVWKRVQVFALPAIGAAPAGEEETAIAYACCVCARQAGIFLDVAARLGLCLTASDTQPTT